MASKLVLVTVLFVSVQAVFGDDLGADAAANITTSALYTVADVLTGVGQILAPIINIVTGIPKTLVSVATGLIPGTSALQSVVNNIIQTFTMAIANGLGQLLKFAGTGIGGITSLIGSILSTIQKIAGQGIGGGLNVTSSIGELVSNGLKGVNLGGVFTLPLMGLSAVTTMLG